MFKIFDSDVLIDIYTIRALYVYEDTIRHWDENGNPLSSDTQIDVYAIVSSSINNKFSDVPIARNFNSIRAAKAYVQDLVNSISHINPYIKIFSSGNAVDIYYVLSTYIHTLNDDWNIYADIGAEDNILLAEGTGSKELNSANQVICDILNSSR